MAEDVASAKEREEDFHPGETLKTDIAKHSMRRLRHVPVIDPDQVDLLVPADLIAAQA